MWVWGGGILRKNKRQVEGGHKRVRQPERDRGVGVVVQGAAGATLKSSI